MPIVQADLKVFLSGGAANSDPNASLGGAKSSTEAGATIFDDVSGAESSAGDVEYRCVYVQNNHGTLTLQNAKVFIQANTPSPGTDIAIALAGEGKGVQAETVANENTAPVGESFSNAPVDYATGLSVGNLAPGEWYGVWIRRTVTGGAAAYADSFTIRLQGDTAP